MIEYQRVNLLLRLRIWVHEAYNALGFCIFSWVTMTRGSNFFSFSSLWGKWQQILCFTFLLCKFGKLWNLILLVLNTLWKWKEFRRLKCQEHQAESTSQVSIKFVSWVNITGPEILSSSFWPNFQKQASRKEKVNYFSIVIVLYTLYGSKISFSLQVRVWFRSLEI